MGLVETLASGPVLGGAALERVAVPEAGGDSAQDPRAVVVAPRARADHARADRAEE